MSDNTPLPCPLLRIFTHVPFPSQPNCFVLPALKIAYQLTAAEMSLNGESWPGWWGPDVYVYVCGLLQPAPANSRFQSEVAFELYPQTGAIVNRLKLRFPVPATATATLALVLNT